LKEKQNKSIVGSELVPVGKKRQIGNEAVRVCVRVRPLLSHEFSKEEIIYYPKLDQGNLEGIRIADGQHLVESSFDRVFNQYSSQ
jgi:hypothetical protein